MSLKVVLGYSGGLDTSVVVPWLRENYDAEVICVAADVGQPGGLEGLEEKAKATGASRFFGEERNIPVEGLDATKLYSRDENLWHISHEGGPLEDPSYEPDESVYLWTCSPESEAYDHADADGFIKLFCLPARVGGDRDRASEGVGQRARELLDAASTAGL